MPVNYKVVKMAQPGVKGGGQYKYYARIAKRSRYSFRRLCNNIAMKSTFSEGDLTGAVVSFVEEIAQLLKDGYTVELLDLGHFSLHVGSEGKDTPEAVTSRSIDEIKIHFRPSVMMKKMIQNTKFKKVK